MKETPEDIKRLQAILDESYAKAGEHLRGIITPERRLSAEAIVSLLQGMTLLALATVSSACEPIVSPVDGVFYKGLFWFGSSPTSVRFRHIRKRAAVSATHTRGEELVATVHGVAHEIDTASGNYEDFREVLREVYPNYDNWDHWGKAPYAYIEPRVMFAATFKENS
jgi:nitroimidazol reductase NimA-like FMN-containing flavoprotein (pyridoxamine 5'-phosphate oxidase superfamily)